MGGPREATTTGGALPHMYTMTPCTMTHAAAPRKQRNAPVALTANNPAPCSPVISSVTTVPISYRHIRASLVQDSSCWYPWPPPGSRPHPSYRTPSRLTCMCGRVTSRLSTGRLGWNVSGPSSRGVAAEGRRREPAGGSAAAAAGADVASRSWFSCCFWKIAAGEPAAVGRLLLDGDVEENP